MGKRATLASLTHKKPAAEPAALAPAAAPAPAKAEGEARKGLIVRLNVEAWKQLKRLALEEEVSAHDLLIEGVNAVFEKRGKPPIALKGTE